MVTTPRKQSVARWFLRTYLGRIIIALVLIIVVQVTSFWLMVVIPYQREQSIAEKIKANGGHVVWHYLGATWIPQSAQEWFPIFNRIYGIQFGITRTVEGTPCKAVPLELLEEIGSVSKLEELVVENRYIIDSNITEAILEHWNRLRNLKRLRLSNIRITNTGLKHLKHLTSLSILSLNDTAITDKGLQHFKEMTNLNHLFLYYTETTPEGREMLRKALPNCMIRPNP